MPGQQRVGELDMVRAVPEFNKGTTSLVVDDDLKEQIKAAKLRGIVEFYWLDQPLPENVLRHEYTFDPPFADDASDS